MKAIFPLPPDEPVDPKAVPFNLTPYERSCASLYACFLEQHVRTLNARDKAQEAAQEAGELHRLGVRYEP